MPQVEAKRYAAYGHKPVVRYPDYDHCAVCGLTLWLRFGEKQGPYWAHRRKRRA